MMSEAETKSKSTKKQAVKDKTAKKKTLKNKEPDLLKPEDLLEDVKPTQEQFGLLISDEYELTGPMLIYVQRYPNGEVVVSSAEIGIYAQGIGENDALREFSETLIGDLEELKEDEEKGQKLGRELQIRLSLLKRLIRRIE